RERARQGLDLHAVAPDRRRRRAAVGGRSLIRLRYTDRSGRATRIEATRIWATPIDPISLRAPIDQATSTPHPARLHRPCCVLVRRAERRDRSRAAAPGSRASARAAPRSARTRPAAGSRPLWPGTEGRTPWPAPGPARGSAP